MNFTYDHDLMTIQWNPTHWVDYYIINVMHNESEFTLTTSNTTIKVPLHYNQEYNVTVIANNCAGNSTSAEMSMRVGKYTCNCLKLYSHRVKK